jgi:hypothetical protein
MQVKAKENKGLQNGLVMKPRIDNALCGRRNPLSPFISSARQQSDGKGEKLCAPKTSAGTE